MGWFYYIVAAVFIVSWSLFIYLKWEHPAGFPEDSGWRFFLLASPSTYFLMSLLLVYPRWQTLPLDLFSLFGQIVIILLGYLSYYIALRLGPWGFRKTYVGVVIFYNVLSCLILFALFSVRLFPPLLIPISYVWRQMSAMNFFARLWDSISPDAERIQQEFWINKVVLAFFSYLPIALMRMIYTAHLQKKMKIEIRGLHHRIEELEQKLYQKE